MPLPPKKCFNYYYLNYKVGHKGEEAEQFRDGPGPNPATAPDQNCTQINFYFYWFIIQKDMQQNIWNFEQTLKGSAFCYDNRSQQRKSYQDNIFF